jgi:hypothetical protein
MCNPGPTWSPMKLVGLIQDHKGGQSDARGRRDHVSKAV